MLAWIFLDLKILKYYKILVYWETFLIKNGIKNGGAKCLIIVTICVGLQCGGFWDFMLIGGFAKTHGANVAGSKDWRWSESFNIIHTFWRSMANLAGFSWQGIIDINIFFKVLTS